MPVITLSRSSYSHGQEIAQKLSEKLGYECISRDILSEASSEFHIPELKLSRALHDAPSVLEYFSHERECFIHYVRASFLSHIEKGNVVYHGLAGHFFVQQIPHVLKVRVTSGMDERVQEEMRREKCSEEVASQNLKKDDEARRRWSKHLYGQDTTDSRLYDMVLSLDSFNVDDIVEMVSTAIQKVQFQETEASLRELHNRVLLAKIQAMVTPLSPHVKVRQTGDMSVEISNIEGRLKADRVSQQEIVDKIRRHVDDLQVIFTDELEPYKGHINTFYNLDLKH